MEDTSKETKTTDNTLGEDIPNDKLIDDMSKMLSQGMTFNRRRRNDEEEAKSKVRKFWGTQPVPQFQGDEITESDIGPIDKNTDLEKEQKEPYNLPKGYVWSDIDIHNNNDLTRVINILNLKKFILQKI
jgi:hypothetical protein